MIRTHSCKSACAIRENPVPSSANQIAPFAKTNACQQYTWYNYYCAFFMRINTNKFMLIIIFMTFTRMKSNVSIYCGTLKKKDKPLFGHFQWYIAITIWNVVCSYVIYACMYKTKLNSLFHWLFGLTKQEGEMNLIFQIKNDFTKNYMIDYLSESIPLSLTNCGRASEIKAKTAH